MYSCSAGMLILELLPNSIVAFNTDSGVSVVDAFTDAFTKRGMMSVPGVLVAFAERIGGPVVLLSGSSAVVVGSGFVVVGIIKSPVVVVSSPKFTGSSSHVVVVSSSSSAVVASSSSAIVVSSSSSDVEVTSSSTAVVVSFSSGNVVLVSSFVVVVGGSVLVKFGLRTGGPVVVSPECSEDPLVTIALVRMQQNEFVDHLL